MRSRAIRPGANQMALNECREDKGMREIFFNLFTLARTSFICKT